MIQATIKSLEALNKKPPRQSQILEKAKEEMKNYKMYLNYDEKREIDPMEQMNNYIRMASYNSPIGDIIIPMISTMLQIRIVILEDKGNYYGLANQEHIFGHKGQDTVYFLKTKKHYDALIVN